MTADAEVRDDDDASSKVNGPTDPKRARSFIVYFQNYMSLASIVVACLPVPITGSGVLPTISGEKAALSIFTSLFCFLLLAFIFYTRHPLARLMFPGVIRRDAPVRPALAPDAVFIRLCEFFVGALPLLLVGVTAILAFLYCQPFFSAAPNAMSDPLVKDPTLLAAYYVGMFACAESAFVLMATREYLQDLLGITDRDLILGPAAAPAVSRTEARPVSAPADRK